VEKKGSQASPGSDSIRRGNNATLNAFSRILATLVLLILFGVLGAALDRWLGTSFFILIGFVIGMVFTVLGMLYVVKVAQWESQQGASNDRLERSGGGSSEGDGDDRS
jgi:F0F1-type ATP synthase assembly protein I